MSIKVFTKKDQASGQFNNGEILENKPIGFPQDKGVLKPFSNILYWAHAWTPSVESLIGEHAHQGFEILSFVISGTLSHYDSKLNEWQELEEGDVQIIRAGSGITHAERVRANSSFFQIWFDPNLKESLKREASYDNYPSSSFKAINYTGYSRRDFVGLGAPVSMFSESIEIYEIMFENGSISLSLPESKTRSFYVIKGDLEVDGVRLTKHDFVRFEANPNMFLTTNSDAKIFIIDVPIKPSHPTYIRPSLK